MFVVVLYSPCTLIVCVYRVRKGKSLNFVNWMKENRTLRAYDIVLVFFALSFGGTYLRVFDASRVVYLHTIEIESDEKPRRRAILFCVRFRRLLLFATIGRRVSVGRQ